MKNRKTFYETKTVGYLKEIIEIIQSPTTPHPPTSSDKILLHLRNKNFLMEIYRNIQIYRHFLLKCFKNAGLGRQEMVQYKCLFSHQTSTYILENL